MFRDTWGRCFTEVLVIDALHFHRFPEQFKPGLIRRELNKVAQQLHTLVFVHESGICL